MNNSRIRILAGYGFSAICLLFVAIHLTDTAGRVIAWVGFAALCWTIAAQLRK